MWSVYIHTFPNGKKYVGMCKSSPMRRWGTVGRNYKKHPVMYAAIQKYGWDNVAHEIVASNLTQEEALRMEESLIAQYKTFPPSLGFGYNCTSGGESRLPTDEERKMTSERSKKWWENPENKERMRAIRTGSKRDYSPELRKQIGEMLSSFNRGKHLSEDHKRKISDSEKGRKPWNAGKKMTEEHCKMLSKRRKELGLKHSPETIERIAAASRKPVVCIETGIVYASQREAANAFGLREIKISEAARGIRKTAGGYHWKRAEITTAP